ncbi:MAG: hypothetical protein ACMG6S_26465 [Byssovorax sp.]
MLFQEGDLFVARLDGVTGNPVWSKHYSGPLLQFVRGFGISPQGNVVFGGQFFGAASFGGGIFNGGNNGWGDGFVAAIDASGSYLWSKHIDGMTANVSDVAVDAAGNVVIAGLFTGTLNLGSGVTLTSPSQSIYVAKLDGAGNHIWSKHFVSGGYPSVQRIATDAAGNVLAVGTFEQTTDFGGGPLTKVDDPNYLDTWGFAMKLDAAGNHVFSRAFGGDKYSKRALDVATDPAGNAIVTGSCDVSVDLGAGAVDCGPTGIFIAKYDGAGALVWEKHYTQTMSPYPLIRVSADAQSNLLLWGNLYGQPDFGGGPLPLTGNLFLVKVDAAGGHLWSRSYEVTKYADADAVSVDAAGNVLVVGTFEGTLNFGGANLDALAGQDAPTDVFVAKLAP